MTDSAAPTAFAPACPTGHKLQGFVRHCPYCGLAVPPVKVMQEEAAGAVLEAERAVADPVPAPAAAVAPPPAPVVLPVQSPAERVAPVVQLASATVAKPPVPETLVVKDEPPTSAVEFEDSGDDALAQAQRGGTDETPEPVPERGGRKVGGWIWAFVLLLVAGGGAVYFLWFGKPDECQVSLEAAVALEARGDLAVARAQAVKAVAACGAKRTQQARGLLATIDQTMTAQASCERKFAQIAGFLDDRRLQSAKNSLERLEPECAKFPRSGALQESLKVREAAALEALAQAERFLGEQERTQSASAISRLAEVDREHPDLQPLRKSLQAIDSPPAPPQSMSTPQVLPRQLESDRGQKSDMAKGLLRNAEQALIQMRFDAARTFVESALSVDPHNSEAQALARRIRERELEYLKDSTTLK